VDEAGIAVAGIAAYAPAVGTVRLVEHDARRRVRRPITRAFQAIGDLLNARLVAHGWKRIGCAGRWIGGVVAALAVDVVELFRLRVVRFELLVPDRPVGRRAVGSAMSSKILLAQPKHRGAEHLGRAADEVMDTRLERLAVRVVPRVLRHVTVLHEDFGRIPILLLARQIVAAFEDENALAGRSKLEGERAATGSAADDDEIVVIVAVHEFFTVTVGE
jgi:hypothetical protein